MNLEFLVPKNENMLRGIRVTTFTHDEFIALTYSGLSVLKYIENVFRYDSCEEYKIYEDDAADFLSAIVYSAKLPKYIFADGSEEYPPWLTEEYISQYFAENGEKIAGFIVADRDQ